MRSPFAPVVALVSFALPAAALAAVTCPDRTPAALTKPTDASLKCQAIISKVGAGFVKSKLKAFGKCMAEQEPGLCPTAKEIEKIDKAALKAAEKIAKDCTDDAAQDGLTSSYGNLTDHTPIASCMLSQHNATSDILLGIVNGTPGVLTDNDDRAKCAKTLNKAGIKYAADALKTVGKCLSTQAKDGVAGDLAPICVGQWQAGAFVAPTDMKTAEKLATLRAKIETDILEDCTPPGFDYIPTLFACPGATTTENLQSCIVCEGWNSVLDYVDQEHNESGTLVANGPGAIQAAVNAAAPGAKLLIASGDYAEEVTIATDGLQLVGCGGATGDRPRLIRPGTPGPHANGISAGSTDGLVFQSLEMFDWDENGIFVSGAAGVTFRDVVADGNLNSTYGVFPIQSTNVVIEGCAVTNVADAGIYVGQSSGILVRYSSAEGNVAGIEIENSTNAVVHNNYAANNTGGLLIFKLPGLPMQDSFGHEIFNNVLVSNNTPNFGAPGSTVALIPDGTGLFVLSNDASEIHHNLIKANNTFGIALLDQEAVNALAGPAFVPTSPEQKAENNFFHHNTLVGNGLMKDTTPPNNSPFGANMLLAINDDDLPHGNCFQANNAPLVAILGANDCP